MPVSPADSHEVLDAACQPSAPVLDGLLLARPLSKRLRILCMLRGREVCVRELVEALEVTQSAVSHQARGTAGKLRH